jgi:hypothetical protein
MSDEIAVIPTESLALRHELTVEEVVARVKKVHAIMREAMVLDHHYGKVPGTTKDVLLKPGAELLCLTFRLDPEYATVAERDGKHLTLTSTCTLWHITTGQRFGSGMGSCSTRESKYAYRQAKRACPKCGAEQINKSKFPPRGKPQDAPGWYCYAKSGGCGQEFAADDPAILGQVTGRVANEDLADQENTVLKMANKRSLVAAVLNVTAASDIFTQDLEDMGHGGAVEDSGIPKDNGRETVPTLSGIRPTGKAEPATETTEQEAARLFPQEEELRAALVARIRALKDEKHMTDAKFGVWCRRAIGEAALEAADVAALTDLEKLLVAV